MSGFPWGSPHPQSSGPQTSPRPPALHVVRQSCSLLPVLGHPGLLHRPHPQGTSPHAGDGLPPKAAPPPHPPPPEAGRTESSWWLLSASLIRRRSSGWPLELDAGRCLSLVEGPGRHREPGRIRVGALKGTEAHEWLWGRAVSSRQGVRGLGGVLPERSEAVPPHPPGAGTSSPPRHRV